MSPRAEVWLEAARLRTLPAAVAPVLVGTAAAGRFTAWRFAGALVVALALQVAVNYANDYFDGVAGVDAASRVGPRRVVAAGLVSPDAMRVGTVLALAVAAAAGIGLAAVAGWELLAVGAACFAAALAYSGGPRPYASAGLGELFVFIFFGLVATAGSAYVQDEALSTLALLAGVPIGLLATAILVANNLRDIATDTDAGKRTLAVRLGDRRSRLLHAGLVLAPFPLVGFTLVPATASGWPVLVFAALPLAVAPLRPMLGGTTGLSLIPALVGTARLELWFAVLLSAGLLLA
ncbi:MAG: 1,4-dihydroxy-2-naphthoate polyprenyltransferase [Egibacteraceae bacterium]